MKIEQAPKFKPITITIETAEEAGALWDAIRLQGLRGNHAEPAADFYIEMSNWFSSNAQMGGDQ